MSQAYCQVELFLQLVRVPWFVATGGRGAEQESGPRGGWVRGGGQSGRLTQCFSRLTGESWTSPVGTAVVLDPVGMPHSGTQCSRAGWLIRQETGSDQCWVGSAPLSSCCMHGKDNLLQVPGHEEVMKHAPHSNLSR
jgi:hypothetical protein